MKKGAIYIALFVLWTGCSSDPAIAPQTGAMAPLKLRATQTNFVVKGTSVLPQGIVEGIYVTDKDTDISAAYFKNRKYISASLGELTADAGVDLTIGRSYDIYGYAPYRETLAETQTVEYEHGTDVMWFPKSTLDGVTAENCTAELHFEHRVSQIAFKVVFAKDYDSTPEFTAFSGIEIGGFYHKGLLNITTGVVAPLGSSDLKLSASAVDKNGVMTLDIGRACFIPSSDMQLEVAVRHGEKVYRSTIKDRFEPGVAYEYTVTITKVATLSITGVVKDWLQLEPGVIFVQ